MTEEAAYQHHVRRLIRENEELRAQLERDRANYRQGARELRAQRDEGISPKLRALQRELDALRPELSRAKNELRELKGLRARRMLLDPAVRGATLPRGDKETAVGRATTKIRKLLRHIGVLLSTTRNEIEHLKLHGMSSDELAELIELIELRRQDLLDLAAEMRSAPASVAHRGTKGGYRPVPPDRGTL